MLQRAVLFGVVDVDHFHGRQFAVGQKIGVGVGQVERVELRLRGLQQRLRGVH